MSSLEQAMCQGTHVFLFFVNAGAFVTVHVVIRLIQEQTKNLQLESNNHMLTMQALQYENLQSWIMETRRAKHDIRHHFIVMSGFLERGDYEQMKSYVKKYIKQFPEEGQLVFCEHTVINMLVGYYYQLAKEKNIEFRVKINVPEKIGISDSDLSIT